MSGTNPKSAGNSEEGIHYRPSSKMYGSLGNRQISMPSHDKARRENNAQDVVRLIF